MKNLHFEYSMHLAFSPAVEHHRFTLRCIPISTDRQEISDLSVDVFPKEFLSFDFDSFGNRTIYGFAKEKHDHFSVKVSGTARTGLSDHEAAPARYQVGMFRYQTDYTRPGEAIMAFANEKKSDSLSNTEVALHYMKALHQQFRYVPGRTNILTTAEEAMRQGEGVCQDYAHILLSLCRLHRIPSRYVVGMLTGEGQSHAWVEIWDNGKWIALDPTNDLVVDDQHIKLSTGRDYKDCTINQGVFYGWTTQTQTIAVKVTEQL